MEQEAAVICQSFRPGRKVSPRLCWPKFVSAVSQSNQAFIIYWYAMSGAPQVLLQARPIKPCNSSLTPWPQQLMSIKFGFQSLRDGKVPP
jgi:hypothetical protein